MRIDLVKNLPVASGLGGGTADAAATLRGLMHCWRLAIPRGEINSIAASLGADVPVSILSTAQRMNGIGETVVPFADWRPTPAVLVNPGIECPTADVFRAARLPEGKSAFPGLPPSARQADIAWLRQCRNDLQTTAVALFPVIAEVIDLLESCAGIGIARMSGSGATCFGVFQSEAAARAAAAGLALARPDWWVRQTKLR
jgi:4-diphosphocytidyl-2-C-methyl-D-erythritol kinase